jgi:hypothetical protein
MSDERRKINGMKTDDGIPRILFSLRKMRDPVFRDERE